MRPLILCSNDDGVDSPLLLALVGQLATFADVVVVAPERQRSAASHAITLHKPLRLRELGPGRFSLSGTPADCVYVGLLRVLPRKPDVVVSGINRGFNLGTDVYYSGTVAAAVEGALRGCVAVALSVDHHSDEVEAPARYAQGLLQTVLAGAPVPGTVYNVNIPVGDPSLLRARWTRLGKRRYADDVQERLDPMGKPYVWIGGGAVGHDDMGGDSDCEAVAAGQVSVTPLRPEFTDFAALAAPPFVLNP